MGSDGHTYYWNTRNNHLAFMFNDYAAKPFFGYVEFLTDGTMHLVGNKNHDASKIIEMCEAVGYKVKKLKRIAFGGITTENLKVGEYRALKPHEIKVLYSL